MYFTISRHGPMRTVMSNEDVLTNWVLNTESQIQEKYFKGQIKKVVDKWGTRRTF